MKPNIQKSIPYYFFSFPRTFPVSNEALFYYLCMQLEQERGHIALSIECYMKQQTYDEFHQEIEKAWKDINEEFLRPIAVPMLFLSRLLNSARSGDVMYKDQKDIFTHLGEVMENNISMLLIDPVPICEIKTFC